MLASTNTNMSVQLKAVRVSIDILMNTLCEVHKSSTAVIASINLNKCYILNFVSFQCDVIFLHVEFSLFLFHFFDDISRSHNVKLDLKIMKNET